MSCHHEFLSPQCFSTTLDKFIIRSAILRDLAAELDKFNGTILDIGCGNMPYKSIVLQSPSRAERYIGLDVKSNIYENLDLMWDGQIIPLRESSIDCVLATEVFEHCPNPGAVMSEAIRILKPNGLLFFTVPFLWPLHDVPHDEYRYTPFSLKRLFEQAGFHEIEIKSLGGWDASLAQMLGLWVRRKPMSSRKRKILSSLALPLIRYLANSDHLPKEFGESCMITGLSGTARKPNQ